jgi:hypothetical protein
MLFMVVEKFKNQGRSAIEGKATREALEPLL